jgi:two-component system CheB/CheR fusion protein
VPEAPGDGEMEALLTYINDRRNFDFRGYKRASLGRRIFKRMQQIGVESYQRYMEILEANPGEFNELFNTILINVTSLMRDPDAWDALTESVIPAILSAKDLDDPIRVWSAGCASGEEAYSLAVLLADAAGEERFRQSVKIYATDADSEALVAARQGRYKEKDLLEAFGDARAKRYFEFDSGYGTFRADLRRSLIFGRHDLVQDPPISRIDLVTCRNTLMYFSSQVQLSVLATLHYALNSGGYLFLGKSEALVSRTQLFEVVDSRRHIFRKEGPDPEVSGMPLLAAPRGRAVLRPDAARLAEMVVEHASIAQVVVDPDSSIVLANREARRIFGLGSVEVGRALRDAGIGIRMVDLQTPLQNAIRKHQPVVVYDVLYDARHDLTLTFDVIIAPLEASGGAVISFLDVSRYQHLRGELEQVQTELQSAYAELQSAVEELETTNEELQSTNEELETTNEELHSTNEELETMNEELQSTNEELETINNELRERSSEVGLLNRFLESILGSLESAVIVLDKEMQVQAWNRQAEELWGLRRLEVIGQHFLNLDIGFPVEVLRTAIRSCAGGSEPRQHLETRAVNRRGRPVNVSVNVSALAGDQSDGGVLILMDATPVVEGADALPVGYTDDPDGSGGD